MQAEFYNKRKNQAPIMVAFWEMTSRLINAGLWFYSSFLQNHSILP